MVMFKNTSPKTDKKFSIKKTNLIDIDTFPKHRLSDGQYGLNRGLIELFEMGFKIDGSSYKIFNGANTVLLGRNIKFCKFCYDLEYKYVFLTTTSNLTNFNNHLETHQLSDASTPLSPPSSPYSPTPTSPSTPLVTPKNVRTSNQNTPLSYNTSVRQATKHSGIEIADHKEFVNSSLKVKPFLKKRDFEKIRFIPKNGSQEKFIDLLRGINYRYSISGCWVYNGNVDFDWDSWRQYYRFYHEIQTRKPCFVQKIVRDFRTKVLCAYDWLNTGETPDINVDHQNLKYKAHYESIISESEDEDDSKNISDNIENEDKNESDENESDENESDKNESNENKGDENESNENRSDENESDENESDKNESDENESDENKGDENESNENRSDENESDENESDENESNENKSNENESDENESDENESDENESDENESDENRSDENESNENKGDENESNENRSDENESDENESDENESEENESNENKSNENESNENESDENESDENESDENESNEGDSIKNLTDSFKKLM
ncbi:hypothetical protein ACTA71_000241 [Dictyostelium dimigraforme]